MIRNLLAGLLVLAYMFALVMSTGHLSEWYRLTLGELPRWFAVGLAAALEASAFLLSLLSNSLLRGSTWASWGALVALGLVWVGNYFSMTRAGVSNGVPGYEVFLSSLFVPVSTYVVAKVLGELLYTRSEPEVKPIEHDTENVTVGTEKKPTTRNSELTKPMLEFTESSSETSEGLAPGVYNGEVRRGRRDEEFLALLTVPRSTREVAEALGITRAGALKRLRALEARGLVRNTEAGWLAVGGE